MQKHLNTLFRLVLYVNAYNIHIKKCLIRLGLSFVLINYINNFFINQIIKQNGKHHQNNFGKSRYF